MTDQGYGVGGDRLGRDRIEGHAVGFDGRSRGRGNRARGRTAAILLLLMFSVGPLGCVGHRHTVGDGPQGGEVRYHRTWYAAWGFVGIGDFDTATIAGPAESYRITTAYRGSDVLINFFTFPFGFLRRTTQVEK